MTTELTSGLPIGWWKALAYNLEKNYNGLGFREYAAKVLPGYKPEVLWYSIQRAKANGVI